MRPISRLAVIANLTRPRAAEGLAALARAASGAGIALLASPETAARLPGAQICGGPADFAAAGAQGVVSLGGDGSFLAAAHVLAAAGAELPLIGLNIGRLGYLTAVDEEGFGATLRLLAAGRYAEEARTALAAEARRGGQVFASLPDALNDVVIARAEGGHAFALELSIDGAPVARWLCDGVIVATPTGSTAYSLSVGGPVMAPAVRALVVSVIAPHALSARPLVVPDAACLEIRIAEDRGAPATVYADGQSARSLLPGDAVAAAVSPRPVRLLVPEGRNPYAPLSRKLGWGVPFAR